MTIKGNRIGVSYQKSGGPLLRSGESHDRIFHLLGLVRRLTSDRKLSKNLQRILIPADELYNISIEIVEELLLLVLTEHRHSSKKNVDIKFERDTFDELGNPKISEIVDREGAIVASDEVEIEGLRTIVKDLISLRRNRRPQRPFIPPPPKKDKKSSKDEQKNKRRKRYLYSKKDLKEAKAFYNLFIHELESRHGSKERVPHEIQRSPTPWNEKDFTFKNVKIELKEKKF
jgi:hypothetical protein